MSTTATKKAPITPAALPRLADHPAYADALRRAEEMNAPGGAARAELAEVDREIDAIQANVEGRRREIRERAISDILKAKEVDRVRADVAGTVKDLRARRDALREEIDLYVEAGRRHFEGVVLPARRAALDAVAPALRADLWAPYMRVIGVGLVKLHGALVQAERLVDALRDGDLGEVCHPDPIPAHLADAVAISVRELTAAGYLSPADPDLAGTPFAAK